MNILTVATRDEGYFRLLKETSEKNGFSLKALGWNQRWKGFAWKLELYAEELAKHPAEEPIICVDGYDVLVVGTPRHVLDEFKKLNHPIIFSGQRYFPTHKWMRTLADKLMSNNSKKIIGETDHPFDYSRPCLGLMMGYAGALCSLFKSLLEIEKKEQLNNDQVLLNIYYLENPSSILLDYKCEIFQNLWRTNTGLYGKISTRSKDSEIEIVSIDHTLRVRNKVFDTFPDFIHGPMNLDLSLVLQELSIEFPPVGIHKSLSYWKYSMWHHLKRGIKFFWKELLMVLLLIALLFFLLGYHYH